MSVEFGNPVDAYGLSREQKTTIRMGISTADDEQPLLGKVVSAPNFSAFGALDMQRDAGTGAGSDDIKDIQVQSPPLLAYFGSCICFPLVGCNSCFVVNPRQEVVLTHFGVLTRMEKEPGCHCALPFGKQVMKISTKQESMFLPEMKVADATGAPVVVSAVLNYRVVNSKRALLNVTSMSSYLNTNAQAVLKQIVGHYTYDQLKSEQSIVNRSMLARLGPILDVAGVSVQSMQLNELNYAPEIASGMLRKQQAAALISARKLIVEGAVLIAQDAVLMLEKARSSESNNEPFVQITNDQKVQLISNLLTVTCSDVDATPTVSLK